MWGCLSAHDEPLQGEAPGGVWEDGGQGCSAGTSLGKRGLLAPETPPSPPLKFSGEETEPRDLRGVMQGAAGPRLLASTFSSPGFQTMPRCPPALPPAARRRPGWANIHQPSVPCTGKQT